jgi:predicted RNA-binding Zn-ribbon protein involved in translation (DUF1610 family)
MPTASTLSLDPCPLFQAEITTANVIIEYETEALYTECPNCRDAVIPE